MTDELQAAIKAYGADPCALCGQPLGDRWGEYYNPHTDRLEKQHLKGACPPNCHGETNKEECIWRVLMELAAEAIEAGDDTLAHHWLAEAESYSRPRLNNR